MLVDGTVFDWMYHAFRWTWHDPDGYNFISGPLADITLIGGGYAILRRHNCHAKGCWRLGRHVVPGTDYIVCRHHHPHDTPTAEQILAEHRAAVQRGKTVAGVAERVAHGAEKAIHDVEEVVHDEEHELHREEQEPPQGLTGQEPPPGPTGQEPPQGLTEQEPPPGPTGQEPPPGPTGQEQPPRPADGEKIV